MNSFECVFITASEDKKLLTSVEDIIQGFKGKVVKKEEWGKKPFSYRLNNFTEGYYYVWDLQIEGTLLAQLKNRLNLEEGIIRYLILKED